ncbi:hypothetical protein [Sulfurimonas sp.]|uniref:hypothetical protein n=1 Tax=Sulfurimonas sp. TaxID=2022749 RepID=UPI0025FBB346|nr:hypothetical protein [Sulfurimonas sp.]MBW6487496.1 hypothetical protein [Sulfurimonas sp.]
MLKIVKKASNKQIGCDLTKVTSAPLVSEKKNSQSYKMECGLNAFVCGNRKMRRVS